LCSQSDAESEKAASLFVTAVGNLKTASAPALNHNFAVQRAQFDLSNVSTRTINLFGDQLRALRASLLSRRQHLTQCFCWAAP
jgi:hypothetical protein